MKRLKMAIAALLAFALLPLIGSTALADESSASSRAEQIRAAANIETIADASTMGDWSGVVENTTQNIGRIWTDKTVSTNDIDISGAMSATVSKDDSDFITALSVLSSTSNIASTSTTPLDIVLVLDASGSMDDSMTGGKRIDALKNAANAFIDEIATQNAGISDASKQHQVSIVKFAGKKSSKVGNDTYREDGYVYNYSQVMKNMTACSETTKSSFKDTINAIKPAGATNAAAGMELAHGQTSKRSDAKKIVIFFTDGTPTTQSEFSNVVASDAIAAAKTMKDAGASVYTIGIFKDANPKADVNTATNENKFMQAASSNYPAAAYTYTQYWWGGEWKWSFGNRAEGSDFYKSASSASELSKIFEDISKEIVKGAGYPTDAREGFEMSDGYITFDDSLGSYMQVDAFKAIVVNSHVFSDVKKTTTDTADTYTFAGTTELNGKTASLGNIVITVTKSSDIAVGDKVQVKVPAGLIPLRNFNVNETAGTMTVSDTYPLRVFFTSSIKPDALALVANPDEAMTKYIAANTENGKVAANTENGKVNFYANAFTPGAALGDTVSHFNPSKGNAYYYFTSDTPIYADEACTQPATRGAIAAGGTHYYQNHFFAMGEGGAAVSQTEVVSFPSGTAEQFSGALAYDASGNAYFKAGTARLTYIDELAKSKAENITGTATDVLNPKWNSETSTSAATTVIPHLGNNGKLSVEIPGTLAVSKTLDMPEGFDAAAYSDKSFDFELTVEAAAGKTLHAEVKNDAGDVCGDPFELTFDKNGKATHSIKADETLYVYGVAPNAHYSVEELLNVPADDGSLTHANPGFLQSSPTDAEGKAIAATGAVVAGEVTKAEFVNTYAAQGTLEGSTALAGAKTLKGRAWLSSDKFTFLLKDANKSVVAPMPEGASDGVARLEVTQPEGTPAGTQVGFHFGDIVYTQPGTYIYQIYESEENSTVNPGVSMSQALYEVKVVVADKHDGTLSVESAMTKLAGDDGVEFKTPEAAELAAFTNTFSDKSVTWNPSGTKTWNDATGQRTLESGMFFVMAKTIDASAPLPEGDGVEAVTGKTAADVDYRGVVSTVSASGSIAFPQATFSLSDLGGAQSKTYVYEITEVVKVGDTWVDAKDLTAGQGLPGVTYDSTVWQATVTVKSVVEGGDAHIELSVAYSKQGATTDAEAVAFAFENSYNPKPAVPAISGTKVFQGRAMTEAESFGFGLVPTDAFGAEFAKQATVGGLANGGSKGFDFGELSFNKPGTYTFKMVENAYCGEALNSEAAQASNIAFDTHECTVTVKVTDDHSGVLHAKVSYDGGNTFTNVYSEEKTYGSFGGLAVEKTLNGRTMHAGEFAFSIEGANDASKALLDRVDKDANGVLQFSNPNDRAAGVADVMKPIDGIKFTQADAGKTFEFVVSEVVPGDDAKLAGVTYDEATHKVKIAVSLKDGMNLDVATYVDGKLVERGTPTVAFTNTYAPANTEYATTNFGLNKVLEGRDWTENDSFSFSIVAETGAPMPSGGETATVQSTGAKDGEAVPFGFGSIRFTADDMIVDGSAITSKTFVYTVSETVPNPAKVGIQYSTNVAKIYVTVTDDGEGHLVATSSTENVTFVNKYETSLNYTAAGGLTLTKTLNGRDMTQGQFQIRVVPHDEASAAVLGLPMSGKVFDMPAAKDGKEASVPVCSDVEFTQLDADKTFTYAVSELGDAGNGYTFDTAVRTVAIAVSDDPATATLMATTTVSGGPDAATYTYKTGDSPAADAAKVAFVNSYAASGSVDVNATKTLSGRALVEGEFAFGMQYAEGEAAGSDVLMATMATNAADGVVAFDTLNFDTAKLNELVAKRSATKETNDRGIVTWTIPCIAYEKTDGLSDRGITATTQSIPFTINAVDDGSGTLAVTIEAGDKGLAFENTYGTGDASVSVTGVKHLSRAEGLTPGDITDKFTFSITANEDGAPMPERVTATNDVNGSIDFGKIVFTLDALNKALGTTQQGATADTGAASIQSAAPAANDVVAAGTTAGVGVAGDSATPAQAATGDDLAGNAADGAANADGAGQGAVPVSDDAVGLAAAGGAEPAAVDTAFGASDAAPSGNASDQPTASVASGNAVAAANAATDNAASVQGAAPAAQTATVRSHVFTYTITETGSAPGVTNDTSVKTVSFKVTDNGKGELTVERVGDETKPTFEFTNAYSVTPVDSSVTDQIPVSKSLVGRDLVEGEFLFELVENGQVVARGANDAAGNVAMSAVTYTTTGKHDYVLREVGAGTTHNGVTFDGKSIAIHTSVVDNGEGSLVVKHALATDDANAAFVNTYAHGTTSVVLGATKVLSGKALADGQFTFALTAEDGTVYQAKNDAAGSVAFPALTFAEPGTYVYTISEVNDKQANVTYDTATYNVVVNVVDDGQGNLVATVAYDDGAAPTFKNSYTEPPAPTPTPGGGATTPKNPVVKLFSKTADDAGLMLGAAAVAAGLALVVCGAAACWRRRS